MTGSPHFPDNTDALKDAADRRMAYEDRRRAQDKEHVMRRQYTTNPDHLVVTHFVNTPIGMSDFTSWYCKGQAASVMNSIYPDSRYESGMPVLAGYEMEDSLRRKLIKAGIAVVERTIDLMTL